MKIYGIKNCTTVKKALAWLDTHKINYEFHDFKKLGISKTQLEAWAKTQGIDKLLNRRGTTWRKISPELQKSVEGNYEAAIQLMIDHTSVIKRPILETSHGIILGFDQAAYENLL